MKRILIILALVLAALALLFYAMDWDAPAIEQVEQLRNPALTLVMQVLAFLGSVRFLLPMNLLLILLEFRKTGWNSIAIPLSTLLVWILNAVIKRIVGRARPIGNALASEASLSFPSGHAMVSTFFVLVLALRYHRKKRSPWLLVLAGIYILLMGFSRVYLGVHYPSDVFGGSSLAFLLSALYLFWAEGGILQRYGQKNDFSGDNPSDS